MQVPQVESPPVLAAPADIPLTETLGVLSRYVALITAWVATCGSLFFSEVLGWTPCVLCWYQRIAMYPLGVLIAIGILQRDDRLHRYVLPLALGGAAISSYHYLLVKTDWLPPPPCTAGIPCTVEYLNWFGFVNIPFLALTAFLVISFSLVASTLAPYAEELPPPGERWSTRLAVVGLIALIVIIFVNAARLV